MIDDKLLVARTAKRIRSARNSKHLTQAQVAKKVGISTNYYAQVERAEKNPASTLLYKIIDALGVASKDILGR